MNRYALSFTVDGAREFLHQALLPLASHRAGPEGQRCALLYPVRAGLRAFLEGCRMDLLTDRRVGVPA